MKQPTLIFSEFKNFLTQQTRQSLAAINLLLAQSLRTIGVSQYYRLINSDETGNWLLKEDEKLLEDHYCVGDDILSSLAHYFGISIRLLMTNNGTTFEAPLPENTTSFFSLLNQEGHWHYLLPETQSNGLAKLLPFSKTSMPPPTQRHKSQILRDTNKQLIQNIKKDYLKTSIIFSNTMLTRLSVKLKQIFNYLKEIFNGEHSNANELKIAKQQAELAVRNSTKVLDALRQTWNNVPNQLDKKLNSLGLRDIEKALIKGPLITDNSCNATVASILQNAEIASFFSRNYSLLTPDTPITSQTPTCKL